MRAGKRLRSGQALVEFALVVPLLLLVLLAVVSFGFFLNADVTVQQAARIGARAAAVGTPLGCPGDTAGSRETIYGLVDGQIDDGVGLSDREPGPAPVYRALIAQAVMTRDAGDPLLNRVTLTVAYRYHPLLPLPGLLPSPVRLAQTYSMLVESRPPVAGDGRLEAGRRCTAPSRPQ